MPRRPRLEWQRLLSGYLVILGKVPRYNSAESTTNRNTIVSRRKGFLREWF
jgi:hypothetical protein